MKQRIEFKEESPNLISIESPQSSRASRIVLLVFMIIFFVIPIAATIVSAIHSTFHPAIIITYIIFGLSGRFFLKLFLWNKYGKEYLSMETDKIVYEADYRYFRGNRREVEVDGMNIGIQEVYDPNENIGVLTITDKYTEIRTAVKLLVSDLEILKEKIENNYA